MNMRAELTSDHTVRTITIMVEDGPIVDVTRPWQKATRRIKVTALEVKINPEGEKIMRAVGNIVRKDDSVGIPAESVIYSADGKIWDTRDIETAPAILKKVFVEAEHGMRVWSDTAPYRPGGGA